VGGLLMQAVPRYPPPELPTIADQGLGDGLDMLQYLSAWALPLPQGGRLPTLFT